MSFDDFLIKQNAKRVAHVARFTQAHDRLPTLDEMNEMFGYTQVQHQEILDAHQEGRPAMIEEAA